MDIDFIAKLYDMIFLYLIIVCFDALIQIFYYVILISYQIYECYSYCIRKAPSAQFPRTSKGEIFFYIHPNTQVRIPTRHSHAPESTFQGIVYWMCLLQLQLASYCPRELRSLQVNASQRPSQCCSLIAPANAHQRTFSYTGVYTSCRILRAFRVPAEADRLPGVDRQFLRLSISPVTKELPHLRQ